MYINLYLWKLINLGITTEMREKYVEEEEKTCTARISEKK